MISSHEEVVDVVDPTSAILFQTTKADAHRRGLLHRTVIGEVRDPGGNTVLVRQTADRQDPGLLVSPVGGHVRAGESEEEALLRETDEEIGLTSIRFAPMGRFIFKRRVLQRIENHLFVVFEIYADPGAIVLGSEADSLTVMSRRELSTALRTTPEIFGASFHAVVRCLYGDLPSHSLTT